MNTTPYHLFVSTACSCCEKILDHLKVEQIHILTTNVDEEEHKLPFPLVILPALVKEKKLIGYGCDDIIGHLNKI